jgi:hypothetical protein
MIVVAFVALVVTVVIQGVLLRRTAVASELHRATAERYRAELEVGVARLEQANADNARALAEAEQNQVRMGKDIDDLKKASPVRRQQR